MFSWQARSTGGFRSRNRDLREAGYSLVELVTVVAIVGIMAAIAVPTFINIMPKIRLGGAVQTLANEIALSRMAAIAKSTEYQVVFDTAGESYSLRQFVGGGWGQNTTTKVGGFADIVSVAYLDGTTAPAALQLYANGTTSVPMSKQVLTITLQTRDTLVKKRVVVWNTGRVYSEKWAGNAWIKD